MLKRLFSVLIPLALTAVSCRSMPPPNPAAETVAWRTYTHDTLGFRVDYPDVYTLDGDRGEHELSFRLDGYPVLLITHMTRGESDRRGLWADHRPVGTADLGGRAAERYVYDHHDGPAYVRTVSFVVEHEGRWLALEFRVGLPELDDVQRRIRDSLTFDPLAGT